MTRLRPALLAVLALLCFAAPATADVVDDRIAAVSRTGGELLLFARGDDGALHVRSGLDGSWSSLGVPISSGPAAVVRNDGTVDVVARAPDRTLTYASLRGATWSEWRTLGGTVLSAPALVARQGTETIDLFVRGDDSGLYQRSFTPGGGWGAGVGLGAGEILSAPSAVSRRPNYLDVYVHGVGGGVFVRGYDGQAWGPYIDTEGGVKTNAAPFALRVPNADHLIMARGLDGSFNERRWEEDQSAYGPWTRIDARPISSAPSAVVDGQGDTVIFAREGEDVLTRTFVPTSFGSWRSLGPVRAPAAAPQPPTPAPAPVGGGQVSFEAGLSCTPRGGRVKVSVDVRKRGDRRKPRVTRVVFFYKRGKRSRVARSDRRAPYQRSLPVALKPGTYRVYARIEYKRGRKSGRKTVSRRFAVCG